MVAVLKTANSQSFTSDLPNLHIGLNKSLSGVYQIEVQTGSTRLLLLATTPDLQIATQFAINADHRLRTGRICISIIYKGEKK